MTNIYYCKPFIKIIKTGRFRKLLHVSTWFNTKKSWFRNFFTHILFMAGVAEGNK